MGIWWSTIDDQVALYTFTQQIHNSNRNLYMPPSPDDPWTTFFRALSNPNISNRGVPNDHLLAFLQLVERSIQCSDPTQKWDLVMRTLVSIEQDPKIEERVRDMAQVLLGMVSRRGLIAGDIKELHRQPTSQVPSTPQPLKHPQSPFPPIQRSALRPPSTSHSLAVPRPSPIPSAWGTSNSTPISTLTCVQSTSQAVPIVRKKSVRFSSKKIVQEANGKEREEIVIDNEGKTRRKKKGQDASGI